MARQSSRNRSGWSKLFVSMALGAFLLIFLTSGSTKSESKTIRSGQAKQHVAVVSEEQPPVDGSAYDDSENDNLYAYNNQNNNSGAEYSANVADNGYGANTVSTDTYNSAATAEDSAMEEIQHEEDLQVAVDAVEQDMTNAAAEELAEQETKVEDVTTGLANRIRIGIGRLFGTQLSVDETEEVVHELEEKLALEGTTELRSAADSIAQQEVDSLQDMVDREEDAGYDATEISGDVYTQDAGAVGAIRNEIDSAATQVTSHLKARAAEIEKEILEERLTKKLGKRVKLVIVDDEVQGLDDLLDGLDNLEHMTPTHGGAPTSAVASTTNSYKYGDYGEQQQTTTSAYGYQSPSMDLNPAFGTMNTQDGNLSPSGDRV